MTDASEQAAESAGKASALIDTTLQKFAATIDGARDNILERSAGEKSAPLVTGLAKRLTATSASLRATSGDDVVNYAKNQIERHPTLLTIGAAAVAIVTAQLAVGAVRKERRQASAAELDSMQA